MKAAGLFLVALSLLSGCSTASRSDDADRLPMLRPPDNEEVIVNFELDPVKSQPWLAGDHRPPTSPSDLGFSGQVRLASVGLYSDGGSAVYLLTDGAGHYFMFCTSNPRSAESAFLLGTRHFSDSQLCRVNRGTPSYRFLYDLLWSFADDPRYQYTAEQLERARESSGMSKKKFKRLIDRLKKRPNQSPEPTALSVTICACAQLAPASTVAHL